jgi:adenosine deaminase
MIEIVRAYDLDLPRNADQFRSLVHILDGDPFTHTNFLSKFKTLRLMYQSPELIKRITREAIADAADDNVRYMELRFTPVALTRIKDFPLSEAMDWVIETVEEASEEYGVLTSLITTVNRHEDLDLAEEVVKLSVDRKNKGVVSLDLTGNEADFPGEEFEGIFKEAKQSGLRITIHAGEWGGPKNIELAVNKLGAERIGHGVRVLEDPKVVDMARERKITFEVCPTSNYQSGVFPSIEEHALPKMMEKGLNVTLNTDDPGISQIDLSDEYELACEFLDFDVNTLQETILNAARSAFLPDGKHEKLISILKKEFQGKQ